MVTTYTDTFGIALTGVETILETEFSPDVKVYISDVYEEHGKKSFRISATSTDHLTRPNAGESRTYVIEITYYVDFKPGRERMKHLMDTFSRLNRIVGDNNVYRVSGTYKWHDANLGLTVFGERTEDEPDWGTFKTNLICTIVEGY